MSQTNPYQPPQSVVGDSVHNQEVDINNLPVSDAWKRKFHSIQRAGGPSMPYAKSMSKQERRGISYFNILAFLFGPIYYLVKGMWKKAIVFSIVCISVVIILELVLEAAGFKKLGNSLGYGVAAVFAVRANFDYYKKMVLKDNGWW